MVRGKQPYHTASRSTGSAPQSKKQRQLAAAAAAAAENAAAEPTPEASSSDEEGPPPPGSAAQAAQARNKSNQDSAETLKRKFDELEKENARLRERLEKVRWLCNV